MSACAWQLLVGSGEKTATVLASTCCQTLCPACPHPSPHSGPPIFPRSQKTPGASPHGAVGRPAPPPRTSLPWLLPRLSPSSSSDARRSRPLFCHLLFSVLALAVLCHCPLGGVPAHGLPPFTDQDPRRLAGGPSSVCTAPRVHLPLASTLLQSDGETFAQLFIAFLLYRTWARTSSFRSLGTAEGTQQWPCRPTGKPRLPRDAGRRLAADSVLGSARLGTGPARGALSEQQPSPAPGDGALSPGCVAWGCGLTSCSKPARPCLWLSLPRAPSGVLLSHPVWLPHRSELFLSDVRGRRSHLSPHPAPPVGSEALRPPSFFLAVSEP